MRLFVDCIFDEERKTGVAGFLDLDANEKHIFKFRKTTPFRLELLSIILALKHFGASGKIQLFLYSEYNYGHNVVTNWIYKWNEVGFHKAKDGNLSNIDLLERIKDLLNALIDSEREPYFYKDFNLGAKEYDDLRRKLKIELHRNTSLGDFLYDTEYMENMKMKARLKKLEENSKNKPKIRHNSPDVVFDKKKGVYTFK